MRGSISAMRYCGTIGAVLLLCGISLAQAHRPASPLPDRFVIGRHTFFDFGPPFDYYELLLVRPTPDGTSIERILLTPVGDACTQPAKIETASASVKESVATLLGNTDPCTIPEKELRRERKRCKKCLVFSGANVAMQVQCGTQTLVIRSDILDRDMFDPAPNTPVHTSWTMQLLGRLDKELGPGVMDKPMISLPVEGEPAKLDHDSDALRDVSLGKYDALFQGVPNKPSDLYRDAQFRPPTPTVRLLSSLPIQPQELPLPQYPPLARMARIEGKVIFKVEIDSDGNTKDFSLVSGHPMLRESVKQTVSTWRFPKDAAGEQVNATIEFATNCPAKRQ
jgi:TonB family protein